MNGCSLTIFSNMTRHTDTNDHILVICGAGRSNFLRQLATDSGVCRIHDPLA